MVGHRVTMSQVSAWRPGLPFYLLGIAKLTETHSLEEGKETSI